MSKCRSCGTETGEAKFCPECGTKVQADQTADEAATKAETSAGDGAKGAFATDPTSPEKANTAKEPKKKKKRNIVLIVIAVIVVLGIIGSAGNSNNDSTSDSGSSSVSSSAANDSAKQKIDGLKAELQTSVDEASAYNAADYTPETYQVLTSAIDGAKAVIANENATENECTDAKDAISNAIGGLKEAFDPNDYSWPAYTDVARTPDAYKGSKIAFTGKVIQVVEGTTETNLRVATDGSYGDVVFVGYDPDIMGGTRVLEDDNITMYGTCIGLYTYTSTLNASISLPGMYVDHIVIN